MATQARTYGDIYVAMRAHAVGEYGDFGNSPIDGKILPRAPRIYFFECADYFVGEINRLTGHDRLIEGLTFDVGGAPVRYLPVPSQGRFASFQNAAHGVVNEESGRALFDAWGDFLEDMEAAFGSAFPSSDVTTNAESSGWAWRALGRLAHQIQVDRATPSFTGVRAAWTAIVDSAKELPGRVGQAAREAAELVTGFGLGILGGILGQIVKSPLFWTAVAVGAFIYRSQIGGAVERLRKL